MKKRIFKQALLCLAALPMLTMCHGYGWDNDDEDLIYRAEDYRGETGYGPAYGPNKGLLFEPIISSSVAYRLNHEDRDYIRSTLAAAHNARPGSVHRWDNPNTGMKGSIEVIRDGYNQYDDYCREYAQTLINPLGKHLAAMGSFCQEEGRWLIQRP